MHIHRNAALSGRTAGKTMLSKQRSPRSLIDQTINVGQSPGRDPSVIHRSAHLLANSLSVDGNGVKIVDVEASFRPKIG